MILDQRRLYGTPRKFRTNSPRQPHRPPPAFLYIQILKTNGDTNFRSGDQIVRDIKNKIVKIGVFSEEKHKRMRKMFAPAAQFFEKA